MPRKQSKIQSSAIYQDLAPILDQLEPRLLSMQREALTISGKPDVGSQASVVTDADIFSDEFLRRELKAQFPDFGFLTEEGNNALVRNGYNWIIDPIDGTANYANLLDTWGVSIGLWGPEGGVFGCIAIPGRRTRIWGGVGEGLQRDGQVLKYVSQPVSPKKLITIAPIWQNPAECGRVHQALADSVGHSRDLGCSSWQSYLVLAGQSDAVVHYRLSIWDIGAAVVLAQELGLAMQYIGTEPDLTDPEIAKKPITLVFGHPELVPKIARALTSQTI